MIRALGQIVFVILIAVLVEEWLRFVFKLFPYTRPWAEHLTGYVAGIVSQVWAAIIDAVPGLVMVAVIAALAHLAMKVVRTVARAIEAGRYRLFGIDADVVQPTRRIITAAIWLFALAMAYPYLPGSSSEAFKGLTVLVGVMVSLGASGVVGQAAGGFILTYSRALRDGEWVRDRRGRGGRHERGGVLHQDPHLHRRGGQHSQHRGPRNHHQELLAARGGAGARSSRPR